jgi:hypothetical protein
MIFDADEPDQRTGSRVAVLAELADGSDQATPIEDCLNADAKLWPGSPDTLNGPAHGIGPFDIGVGVVGPVRVNNLVGY